MRWPFVLRNDMKTIKDVYNECGELIMHREYGETASCQVNKLGCDRVEKVGVKEGIEINITWLTNQINEYEEKLRVEKAKLALISKDKNLEAYLNLVNR